MEHKRNIKTCRRYEWGLQKQLRLHAHWEIFADTFAATPFLSGDAPGALDYLAAVVSKWSGARAHLASTRPEFAATLERIETDPVVADVFAAHWPPTS